MSVKRRLNISYLLNPTRAFIWPCYVLVATAILLAVLAVCLDRVAPSTAAMVGTMLTTSIGFAAITIRYSIVRGTKKF